VLDSDGKLGVGVGERLESDLGQQVRDYLAVDERFCRGEDARYVVEAMSC
jgi:hypothetical protein